MKRIFSPLFVSLIAFACGTQEKTSDLHIIGGQKLAKNHEIKGDLATTIGYLVGGSADASCTATRVADNVYVSAAHCLVNAKNEMPVVIKASNGRPFEAKMAQVRIISGYTVTNKTDSDLATFGVQFRTTEEKFMFDQFVDVATVDYSSPVVGQPVIIAGFGCVSTAEISGFFSSCLETTGFEYMKSANSAISATDQGLIFEGDGRYFRLSAPFVFDKTVDGYIGKGDSGGPVYNDRREIIGVNSSMMGVNIMNVGRGVSLHNWLGFPHNQNFLRESLAQAASPYIAGSALYRFKNEDVYQGELLGGLPNGSGRMQYADGKIYKGQFANGVRSGQGHQDWNAGAKMISYDGNWVNDRPNGQGTLVFTSGQTYTGNFIDGKMDGKGSMSYPDKDVREGTFVQNKREGEFVLTKPDGSKFLQVFAGDVMVSSKAI